jgi:hypothetical protein
LTNHYQTSYIRGLLGMRDKPSPALRRRLTALLRQLPAPQAILRGSLIERFKRCGKPGCKCATGRGHGPKYYLSISRSGEHPQLDYVPQGYVAQVREYLANYQRTREILEEICAINRELLRRRERL